MQTISGFYMNETISKPNILAPKLETKVSNENADQAQLAGQFSVSKLHKETKHLFSDVISELYNVKVNDRDTPLISKEIYSVVMKNAERLNAAIISERDYNFDYFGIKILKKSYLLKINGKVGERPQHMLMRIAVGIHGENIDDAIETYNLLSEKYFIYDSATLLSIGKSKPQTSSSFSLAMVEDSMNGIYETLSRCALISRHSAGIGLNIHCIRAKGSGIASSGGSSTGLVPMLRVYNATARLADQGGKYPGNYAIYLEPWHADIFEFLNLRKGTGQEDERCRDLFTALWISDLFMKRVESDGIWSLMCPHKSPRLFEVWGDDFEVLYTQYEDEGRFVRQVKARDLWLQIIQSQIETGSPYLLYKDTCNRKSNQQNVGTIRGSTFCAETIQYTDRDEISVGNQASIAVNMFVKSDKTYDFAKLKEVSKVITRNLNKIIDINFYLMPESEKSNKRHRPIGIGIQGLADAFILMRFPYESEKAAKLNQQIFETIYYGALEASCELAQKLGPYETYEGSPVSKGILQYDMWDKTPTDLWDWAALKAKIAAHGVRNSLLMASMPTNLTAQIFGNSESFEPYTSNIFNYQILSNNLKAVNYYVIKDLAQIGMWDDEMKNKIIENNGSIQSIQCIPQEIRDLYKTVWEISVKTTMNMAADRGAFIDQSQSFNIFIGDPSYAKMSSMHFYAWKLGLKTGMFQIRTHPDEAIRTKGLDIDQVQNVRTNNTLTENVEYQKSALACSLNNKDDCMMCGA